MGGNRRIRFPCLNLSIENFNVEIGGMDYGFDINGILGMDYLVQTNSNIDLHQMLLNLKF